MDTIDELILKVSTFSKKFLMITFFKPRIIRWPVEMFFSQTLPTWKPSANKHKFTRQEVEVETREYVDELNRTIEKDRKSHGKKL
ncbi:hypothetical protein EM808_25045 [Niallia taxi]|uniref:Uncharacterized protein n=1 Tax=Niallia taxi TaxID=2499688 RepID=A0A437K473_9BACI|nr:hypothetical protein EM808_25045 [Niallia taxi]